MTGRIMGQRLITGWPREKPSVLPRMEGWFGQSNKDFLSCFVGEGDTVIEVGAFLGLSTLWLAEKVGKSGRVVTIDTFEGNWEHKVDPALATVLPLLWETFVVNCWDMRERIIPVRADAKDALPYLHTAGFEPNVIYIDGSHLYDDVVRDLALTISLWPKARIVGDDFEMETVMKAAFHVASAFRRDVVGNKRCFTFTPHMR